MSAKLDKDFVRAFGPFAQGVAEVPIQPCGFRVPVALEIPDERRAEMAVRLLARIDRAVAAEQVDRSWPTRSARRLPTALTGPALVSPERRARPRRPFRSAERSRRRSCAFGLSQSSRWPVLDGLPRDAVAGKAWQPQVRETGTIPSLRAGRVINASAAARRSP